MAEPSIRSSAAIGVAVFSQSADAAERLIAALAPALGAAERNGPNRVEMAAAMSAIRAA